MSGPTGTRPPFTLRSRAILIWGVSSSLLIALGALTAGIGSPHRLPLWIGVSLALAGGASLVVRSATLITLAARARRSAR
jgi:zinc transporter ZupT